jgi:small subunit ribosomal protein S20
MATHKSAWKRYLQSEKRRKARRAAAKTVRTKLKSAREAIAENTAEPNSGDVQAAVKLIAAAGRKGLMHRKSASRRISRLMKAAGQKN